MDNTTLPGMTQDIAALNEDFMNAVQEAIQESPDTCLVPIAMEYMENVFEALVKKSPKLLAKGQNWEQYAASKDFTVVGRFFQDLKSDQRGTLPSSQTSNKKGDGSSNNISKGSTSNASSGTPAPLPSTEERKTSITTFKKADEFNWGKDWVSETASRDKTVPLGGFSATSAPAKPFTFGTSANPSLSTTAAATGNITSAPAVDPTPTFTFGNAAANTTASSTPSTFTFGGTTTHASATTASSPASTFSFGNTSSASTPSTFTFGGAKQSDAPVTTSSGFSFSMPQPASTFATSGTTPGFSFASNLSNFGKPPATAANGTGTQDKEGSDEEEPPKPDHKPVEEDDALFTQRLKLFELEGGKYKDLGIGNLFIKKIPSGKHQLVIRADNSLGTIILNTVLNESMPMKILKPANILVTVPVAEGKPKTYVFRVKNADMGEDTLKQLEKYKVDN